MHTSDVLFTFNYAILLTQSAGAQGLSGRVFDLRFRGHLFEPPLRPCVMSLSNTRLTYPLLGTGKTKELSQLDCKLVYLDIKHQQKQNKTTTPDDPNYAENQHYELTSL